MEGMANLSGARGGARRGKGSSGVGKSWLDGKGQWRQGEQPQQRLGVGAGHQGPLVQGAIVPRVYPSAGGWARPGQEGCLPWRAEPLSLSIGHPLSSRPLTPGPEQPPCVG